MGNMSYCRFENTYKDFEECYNALANDGINSLSESEKKWAYRLINEAINFAKDFEELLDEEG